MLVGKKSTSTIAAPAVDTKQSRWADMAAGLTGEMGKAIPYLTANIFAAAANSNNKTKLDRQVYLNRMKKRDTQHNDI
jgi:hypothetical protein